jgi:hypothetical protein
MKMIDPSKITDFNRNTDQLQEVLLFWVTVAGKKAITTAKYLDDLLDMMKNWHQQFYGRKRFSPFEMIKNMDIFYGLVTPDWLSLLMKRTGIGCHSIKSRAFIELAYSDLDLKTCLPEDLENITGIGPKTSRAFIIHSRPNQNYACLDVHLLKFMQDKGYDVPINTPTGTKYKKIEQQWLKLAHESGMSPADYDLKIWREYSGN